MVVQAKFGDAQRCDKSRGIGTAQRPGFRLHACKTRRAPQQFCQRGVGQLAVEGVVVDEVGSKACRCRAVGDAPGTQRIVQRFFGIDGPGVEPAAREPAAAALSGGGPTLPLATGSGW
jgi:hypothetical protein